MPRKTMPSKSNILRYWSEILSDAPKNTSVCWGCGFDGYVERCHLVGHWKTQNNDVSNLVLLCKRCHRLQELFCSLANVDLFVGLLKDGAPFMTIAIAEAELFNNLIKENICHSPER